MIDLAKIRERRADDEKGFTLIELLVVVVIMGILIAIAIPVYLNYKKDANDKAAESDLRNAVTTLELCLTENESYPTDKGLVKENHIGGCDQAVNKSDGTQLFYVPVSDSKPDAYNLRAYNTSGNTNPEHYFCYSSSSDGSGSVTKVDGKFEGDYTTTC